MKTALAALLLSLSMSALAHQGGVSSGGGGNGIAHLEVDSESSKTVIVCPLKGTFKCDSRCDSAINATEDSQEQAILDDICSTKESKPE